MGDAHITFKVAFDVELSQSVRDRSKKSDVIFTVMMRAASLDRVVTKVMAFHFSMFEDEFLTLVKLLNL